MTRKRLWWTIRTCLIRGGAKRAEYAKKQHIYAHVGENVSIMPRVIPLYSELISFHDNVCVARNVDFVTHDVICNVFNRLPKDMRDGAYFCEPIGCIEVMDNVFIGSNSVILNNTKIGPNVVIASGSVVTRDCEPNSVYAGVPARKVGTFEGLIQKRIAAEQDGTLAVTRHNQHLTPEEIAAAWAVFNRQHEGGTKIMLPVVGRVEKNDTVHVVEAGSGTSALPLRRKLLAWAPTPAGNEFEAVMGICNLRHIDEEIAKCKLAGDRFTERLQGIKLIQPEDGSVWNDAYYPVIFDGYKEARDEIKAKLEAENIFPRKCFYPVTNKFACYMEKFGGVNVPVAAHSGRCPYIRIGQSKRLTGSVTWYWIE